MGGLLALLAITMAALALSNGGAWLVLLWPALSFLIVAWGYLRHWPEVFGKQSDGSLRGVTVPLLLPYLIYAWVAWYLMALIVREPISGVLLPELHIGRRAFGRELPTEIVSVVDLTSEFAASSTVREGRTYLAAPLLDLVGAGSSRLSQIVADMATLPTPIYLHCAQGHGRTAMVAVAFLLATKRVSTVDAALQAVWAVRPRARPSRSQRRSLDAFAASQLDSQPENTR